MDPLSSLSVFPTQLPGKKDLFIEPDLMSPLDRIANVSTLKVNLVGCCGAWHSGIELSVFFSLRLQQHDVDKLFKVEYKPIISTSDQ